MTLKFLSSADFGAVKDFFVAHELAAVAYAVNILGGRCQTGDLNAVSSLFPL